MAYAVHFRFQWRSGNDNIYRIDILEDGYSGDIVQRPLGGAPQLRRERSGAICGTSLEFQAQSEVDGEFATLYTSNAYAFRVELYQAAALIWQGYITPELYSEPYIATPYNVKVVATDNLGELKLSDYAEQGSVTVATLLSGILSHTGLAFPLHWLSAMHPSGAEDVDPEDTAAAVTINLDHLAGESLYDVLQKVLDTFHAFIVQQGCSWVIVRETDLENLRSDATITAPDGSTFTIGDFGSLTSKVWWPVGYLSQTIVPAKREKVISAPNNWIANLLPATATTSSRASYVQPGNGDLAYYELTPWNTSQQYVQASVDFWSDFAAMAPCCDLVLNLTLSTYGTLSGHTFGKKCAEVYVKIIASDGSSYINRWVDKEGNLSASLTSALDIDGIYRETPEQFRIAVPILSKMAGYSRIYQIQVSLATTNTEDTISRMRLYEWNLNAPEQNRGFQVTCQLNNAARGAAEPSEIAAADNLDKDYETILITNGFKYGAAASGHVGESIEEWASGNILSMPLLEFLARDCCLSIATPRLRMEGTINVPTNTALPLLFRGGGLIYWPESWSWDLLDDRLDISMLSLPAAAVQVTSVTRQALGSGGFVGGTSSGGGAGGPSFFEEDGSGVKLLDEYTGLFARSLEAVNNGDIKGTWKGVTIDVAHGGTGLSSIGTAYAIMFSNSSFGFSLLSPNTATTKKFLSQTGNGANIQSNAPAWSSVGLNDISGGIDYERGVVISTSGYGLTVIQPNTENGKLRFLAQMGYGSDTLPGVPVWSEITVPAASSSVLGGIKLGYSGDTATDYAVQVNASNQAYVQVPWVNTDTTYKLRINGTWNGDTVTGVSLGEVICPTGIGTAGNVLVADSNGYPSWADTLTLTGQDNSTNHVALQVGTSATNRNMRIYGEIRFNGDSAKLNYTSANGMACNVDFSTAGNLKVGTSTSPMNAYIYGKTYIGGTSAYLEYANSVIHANVGIYSDSFIDAGVLSSSSDERLKENLRDVLLTVDQIAGAPAVEFDWKDKSRGSSAGSIAQYWEKILPRNIHNYNGHLSMEYGNIALIAAIILAREVKELRRKLV